MKSLAIATLIVIFSPNIIAQTDNEKLDQLLNDGLELRNAFQYDEAIAKGIQAYALVQEGSEIDDIFEAGMFLGSTYILARPHRSATNYLTEFARK